MSWWALDVRAGEAGHERLAAWLVQRTGLAVEEREDGTLVTFAESEAAADELTLGLASLDPAASVSRRILDTTDWSTRWREGLGPRRFGRLVVVPSWVSFDSSPQDIVVVLDPETAFGSGEHGSTRAALALLERHLRPQNLVLDLGSGSGILAIAAVRLGARRAVGIEMEDDANPIARRNADRNQVADSTEFLGGDAGDLAPLLGPADLICSNILRSVNLTLMDAITRALAPGGRAIFSGMETAESEFFRPELAGAGFTIEDEVTDSGWWAVLGRRP